jgi:hypothetical protein
MTVVRRLSVFGNEQFAAVKLLGSVDLCRMPCWSSHSGRPSSVDFINSLVVPRIQPVNGTFSPIELDYADISRWNLFKCVATIYSRRFSEQTLPQQ